MTPFVRRKPRVADLIRYQAGAAVTAAVACRKRTAAELGRSVDVIDRYCGSHDSNPIYRASLLALAVDWPEALLTHMRIIVERRTLEGRTMESLRQELAEILSRQEPMADARAKMATIDGKCRRELRAALEAEAALQLRACAIMDRIEELEAEQ